MPNPIATTACPTCGSLLPPDDTSLCPACAAEMLLDLSGLPPDELPPASELAERLGFEIPGYTLHAQVGRGGMGRVFRATRDRDGLEVAVKILNAPLLSSDAVCDRFRREIEITSSLDDPRTVRVIESGLARRERIFFYVMEFVDGTDIDAYANSNKLGETDLIHLFLELCDAVSEAHKVGVIHRDLKPSNILVTERGALKILDFGLAKLIVGDQSASDWTRFGLYGTPGYSAPEQAAGTRPPDVLLDVYSLGALLTNMLGPLGDRSGKRNRTLAAIAAKAMEPDPHDRYRSTDDLADDLRSYLADEPVKASPPNSWRRLGLWTKRSPYVAALATAFATTLIALVTSLALFGQREAAARQDLEDLAARQRLQMAELLLSCDSANVEKIYQTVQPYIDQLRPVFEQQRNLIATDPPRQARLAALLAEPGDISFFPPLIRRIGDLNEVRFISSRLLAYRETLAAEYWRSMREAPVVERTLLARAAALAVWAPDDAPAWERIASDLTEAAYSRPQDSRHISETIAAFYPVRQHLLPYFAERFRSSPPNSSYAATLYAGMIDRDFQDFVESAVLSDRPLLESMSELQARKEESLACLAALMRLKLRWDREKGIAAQARCAIAIIRLGEADARPWIRLRKTFKAKPVMIEKMRPLGVPFSILRKRLEIASIRFSAHPPSEAEVEIATGILEVAAEYSPGEINPADARKVREVLAAIKNSTPGKFGASDSELHSAAARITESWAAGSFP